jgi:hypothetical protein
VTSWRELERLDPELAAAGRPLLLNCAATWGVALLGTTRRDGAPRISPLCIYIVEERLLITVDGWKKRDLERDRRYSLHTYWTDGQDEFSVSGVASEPMTGDVLAALVTAEPRLGWSSIVRELDVSSAHSVIYRNFPGPGMYAEVSAWNTGTPTRRWVRDEPTPEETTTATV